MQLCLSHQEGLARTAENTKGGSKCSVSNTNALGHPGGRGVVNLGTYAGIGQNLLTLVGKFGIGLPLHFRSKILRHIEDGAGNECCLRLQKDWKKKNFTLFLIIFLPINK